MKNYNGIEYRRLTRDVKNPHYDRRCRYGTQSVETFPKGWLVAIPEDGRAGYIHQVSLYGNTNYAIAWAEWQEVLTASEATEPAHAGEALELAGLGPHNGCEVLEELRRAGLVTFEQIMTAAEVIWKKDV